MLRKRIYLDYAATTPVDPLVLKAMEPYWSDRFGNPGSLHSFGQEAIAAVDKARETIAKAMGADFREVIFTGSATEANNLTIRGIIKAVRLFASGTDRPLAPAASGGLRSRRSDSVLGGDQAPTACESCRTQTPERLKIITSETEHESVLETCRDLEKEGAEVVYLPVSGEGIVDLTRLKNELDERTVLVSVMYANNETGTIQPIQQIAKIIQEFRREFMDLRFPQGHRKSNTLGSSLFPVCHTDAAQTFQYLDCDVNKLGVDLMTISSHKIYGPKGIGALYISSKLISPIITGGGQEFGIRSGTENVPYIAGFGKAAEIVLQKRETESGRVAGLRDYFWRKIKGIYPKAELNGVPFYDEANKALPNILNIYFPGFKAEELLIRLDLLAVAASAGSACSSRSSQPSYAIRALGYGEERASGSIRFSLGRQTTKAEIDATATIINNIVNKDKKPQRLKI